MGTTMAANYANLFMNMFETSLLNDFHKKAGRKPLNGCVLTKTYSSLGQTVKTCSKNFQHFARNTVKQRIRSQS